jgi:hypothetical protein
MTLLERLPEDTDPKRYSLPITTPPLCRGEIDNHRAINKRLVDQ